MSTAAAPLRVLRHRDFRLLWLANATSSLGDRIVTVALALFIIQLTGSAADLGLVVAAYLLPLVGFMLVGVEARRGDRRQRRRDLGLAGKRRRAALC